MNNSLKMRTIFILFCCILFHFQAKISSLWNSCYAFGWTTGPLIGGVLYDFMEFDGYASFIAILSFAYAIILLQQATCTNLGRAICFNVFVQNVFSYNLQRNIFDNSGFCTLFVAFWSFLLLFLFSC